VDGELPMSDEKLSLLVIAVLGFVCGVVMTALLLYSVGAL
jgi:hypothetical protein